MKTQPYVVGFMFDHPMLNVALLRKSKPVWQRGLLNGPGGKIEPGEEPRAAMIREFKEELGYDSSEHGWVNFCSMAGTNNDGSGFSVEFFLTVGDLFLLESAEEEQLEIHPIGQIAARGEPCVGNVPWLVALAVDCAMGTHPPKKVVVSY